MSGWTGAGRSSDARHSRVAGARRKRPCAGWDAPLQPRVAAQFCALNQHVNHERPKFGLGLVAILLHRNIRFRFAADRLSAAVSGRRRTEGLWAATSGDPKNARTDPRWRRDPEIVDPRSRPISRSSVAARAASPAQPFRRRGVGRSHPRACRRLHLARRRDPRLFRRRHIARRSGIAPDRIARFPARPKRRSASRSRGRVTASVRSCWRAHCSLPEIEASNSCR